MSETSGYEASYEDLEGMIGDDAGETPREARDWFRRVVRTEGVRAAYTAALDVCRDKKAPAPARATAAMTLLRAAGMLNPKPDEDGDDTELAEMTPQQLNKLVAEARADRIRAQEEIERIEREAGLAQPTRRPRQRRGENKSYGVFD